ncbi:MAG: right-handed parallel beta-helix repeat-containing protein [Candidatus Omnitrophica bacterium]|nr:right-handed parallel beta-helix repeat-containing protein [Candidatus Omnitrophota bacterium]
MKNVMMRMLLLTGSLMLGAVSLARADLASGLTGYWAFDEGQGSIVHDATGNNNVGTLKGTNVAAAWASGCLGGNCLSLNGIDNHVDMHSTAYNSDKTFSIWFKLNSSTSRAGLFGNDTNFVIALSHPFCGGMWVNGARLTGSVYSNNNYQTQTSNVLSANVWYHAAFVRDMKNSVISLYLNGALVGSTPFSPVSLGILSGNNYCDANKLKIGFSSSSNAAGPSQYFPGQVDDAALYSRALSAAEINALYQQGPSLSAPSVAPVSATDYYVSARDGDDTFSGTFNEPFRTIQKCSKVAQAGDTCNIRQGTYREMVTISNSGTIDMPVTFRPFSGETVTVSGADSVTGWTVYKDNIYVANVGLLPTAPSQLYVDGKFYDLAHYPEKGYLLATDNAADTSSIIDAGLTLTADQIIGATVITKAVPWNLSTTIATAYDPLTHKITLNGNVFNATQIMPAKFGFYFQNKLSMLDSPGEWFYDALTGKLYLWTETGDDPGRHSIELSTRNNCFLVNGKSYISIQELTIQNANKDDIDVLNAADVQLKGLDVSGGLIGINYISITDSIIQQNTINSTLSTGLGGFGAANNIAILNNTISNAGNVGISPKSSWGGISASGSRLKISGNRITNSGYDGIGYTGDMTVVEDNTIDQSCLILGDCGGIYTTTGSSHPDFTSIIRNNKVTHSFGNYDGTTDGLPEAAGIYLDDYAHGYTVIGNTVDDAYLGIYVHTGSNNTIRNNSVYGSRRWAFFIMENSSGVTAGTVHGNIVSGNKFETLAKFDSVVNYNSIVGDTSGFGVYSYNRYCRPNAPFAVRNRWNTYNLHDWQQSSAQDQGSTETMSLCSRLDALGDVSANGTVTLYDAALTLKEAGHGYNPKADINGDNTVDTADAMAIARKTLGLN